MEGAASGLVVCNVSVQWRSTKALALWILVLFRQVLYTDLVCFARTGNSGSLQRQL